MSNDWNGFDSLDLSDVTEDSGERRLRPGRYVCKITDASIESTKDKKGRKVVVTLQDTAGNGGIVDYINVFLPGKEKAMEIGRKRLKTLLVHGGHENPDKPGDIKNLIGMTVGVNVEAEPYTDQNGKEQMGSAVASWHPYFEPKGAVGLGPDNSHVDKAAAKAANADGTDGFDDDIPF